jgi:TPR repeat protein
LKEATKYYKFPADQIHADDQCNYDFCLEFGKNVSIDLNEAMK